MEASGIEGAAQGRYMIIDGVSIKPTDRETPHCGTCGRPSRICGNCKVDSEIIKGMIADARGIFDRMLADVQHADKAQR